VDLAKSVDEKYGTSLIDTREYSKLRGPPAKAVGIFLTSASGGPTFGHDRDCRCRTPIEEVVDADHHRLDVGVVHIERIRHDARGDNACSSAAARTTATGTTTATTAVIVLPVGYRKPTQPDVLSSDQGG
jgi:hypothetical protein